ncbi:hypothetical protein BWQ96_01830 [Gracilariopsis chorda]|uniref:Uncharacterized protein n=1 Tax=Gracilariopsis chorda TaxID=448386 RepID=A0A2V3J4S0_9FLOR|nr:hypothetical protein BWQ96_01830 [Gracilariopsis chorda]|eukprot:PXF48370.1 hypothetical protein BWQ96_01830 [Gracilariopsis chorda]
MNVTNLLNESVTGVEALAATLSEKRIIRDMLESLYVMRVYDFLMEGEPGEGSEDEDNDMDEMKLSFIESLNYSGFDEAELMLSNVENIQSVMASEFDVAELLNTIDYELHPFYILLALY